jgi:hypothetical protein
MRNISAVRTKALRSSRRETPPMCRLRVPQPQTEMLPSPAEEARVWCLSSGHWLDSLLCVVLRYGTRVELKWDVLRTGDHEDDSAVGRSFGGKLQVAGQSEAGRLAGLEGGLHVAGESGEFDEVAYPKDSGANGEDAAVHHDMSIVDELTGGGDAAGKAEPEDDVVEPAFEQPTRLSIQLDCWRVRASRTKQRSCSSRRP